MNNIFQNITLREKSFLQKVFNQTPEENSIIELNNLLANKSIAEITQSDINDICKKYRFNIFKKFQLNLKEFYATHLNFCLNDNQLSETELSDLKRLKELLNLKENDVVKIHETITSSIYSSNFSDAISSGRLSNEKEEFLNKLQSEIKLPEQLAKKISEELRGDFLRNYIHEAVSDQRLSPDELTELEAITKSLNINLNVDNETKNQLEKFKLYWVIENGEIPTIDVNINLQKNESCYFASKIDWHEQRTVTQRINYGGPVARIRIAKGVYYRVGSISGHAVKKDEWKLIDSGTIYLTNKRLIFVGQSKNTNIRLNRILGFTPYSDGVEIDKDTGRKPLLSFTQDIELFSMLLSRVLSDI